MRLRRLDLTRYGKFTDYVIDFGDHVAGAPDLHIVYGLNEAGKSTSLSAYLDLLFGIEERTNYAFLHQGKTMEIGGCLEFDGNAHELRRIKQRNNSLLDNHGQPANEALLSQPLAGLTRDAYRMMFSLDDETLEAGGNAILESKGDLGELLFSASAGLAGISSTLETAVKEADAIFHKRASKTTIAILKRQSMDLKSRRDEIDTKASVYKVLTTTLQQAETAYDETIREIGAARARQETISRILRVHPLATDYRLGQDELLTYRELPHPPVVWASLLPDLIDEETRLQTRMAGIEQREMRLRDELKSLIVDDRILEMADRFDHLNEAAARYLSAEQDLPKRKSAHAEWSRQVDRILVALGKSDEEEPEALLVPAARIGALRDLITDKSGIDVAKQSAQKEHEAARLALEELQLAQQALDAQNSDMDGGTVAKLQSVLSRLRQGDLAAELRLAERSLTDKQQLFDDAISALYPWSGDGDTLRRISLPDAERIAAWKAALTALDKRRALHLDNQRTFSTALQDDTARAVALRGAASIIDDDEANAVTLERNEAWEQHLRALDLETANRFAEKMQKTDTVAASRLRDVKGLEELRSLNAALTITRAKLEQQSQLLREIDDEYLGLHGQIRFETPTEIELAATAPVETWLAQIDRWAKTRLSALSAWDDRRRTLNAIEAVKATLDTEQQSLAKILADVGLEFEGLPLPALVQAAENALADHAARKSQQTAAHQRIIELARALSARKNVLDEATIADENWQNMWSRILETTWFADQQGSIGAVRALLDALSDLPAALREQGEMQHRIETMETDQREFFAELSKLYADLGEAFDGTNLLQASKWLTHKYDEAKALRANRQDKEEGLVALAEEHDDLSKEIATHAARKAEMTGFFNVETLAAVRQALEQCGQRDRRLEENGKIERQILAEMQQNSLADTMGALADIDLDGLQREQAELAAKLEDMDGRAKALFADRARASDQLAAVGGDDAAARVDAERKTVLLEIEDIALRYLRLRSGSLVAEQALRAYRDKHRSAMMNRASEAFRLMTRDEYTGLATHPDKGRETLIGLHKQSGSKQAIDMSKGTRFQLYLALRLAGYEEFAAARPAVPFIADDIMETFDEPRSEEVFRLFGQMANVGQVIYLTHHRHLCDLARQVMPSVRIHELG